MTVCILVCVLHDDIRGKNVSQDLLLAGFTKVEISHVIFSISSSSTRKKANDIHVSNMKS